MIGLIAAGIANPDANITVGGWDELSGLAPERAGLAASLIGKVFGRLFARQITELTREVATASPVLSRLVRQDGPDPGLYVPGPGRQPAPAEVIVDLDLAERMPWLVERPSELPPGMPRSAMRTISFEARLEEDEGTVIVCAFSGRIGRLSAGDAEAYLPHIRSARLQEKAVAAMATGRITGLGSLHVIVRLGRAPGTC